MPYRVLNPSSPASPSFPKRLAFYSFCPRSSVFLSPTSLAVCWRRVTRLSSYRKPDTSQLLQNLLQTGSIYLYRTVKGILPSFFLKSYLIRSQDVQRCQCNFSMCAETYRPNKQSQWPYFQTHFEMPASYKCLYYMLSSPASSCACVARG